jgi:EF-hand domain pair
MEIDSNNDGVISFTELRRFMQDQELELSDMDVRVMMEEADENHDDGICLEEFIYAIQRAQDHKTTFGWRMAQVLISKSDFLLYKWFLSNAP